MTLQLNIDIHGDALIKRTVEEVKSAVLTEQLAIELDERIAA